MKPGPPPSSAGISIACGTVFDNATGANWPFRPEQVREKGTIAELPTGKRFRDFQEVDADEEEEKEREAEQWLDQDDGRDQLRFRDEEDDVEPERRRQYLLLQTIGAARVDPHGGDGAYSEWMRAYFPSRVHYCMGAHRLEFPGGNTFEQADLNERFLREIDEQLTAWTAIDAPFVVLNWHVRFTGRPNSWTGRGIDTDLLRRASQICRVRGRSLRIIYTIHEYERRQRLGLFEPHALIALNRQVQLDLQADFENLSVLRSRVPNLETTVAAPLVDLVQRYLPDASSLPRAVADGQALGMAYFMRRLAQTGRAPTTARNITIFGLITGRHGLSVDSVGRLATELDQRGVPPEVRVNIVGRAQDRTLADALRQFARRSPRVQFTGEAASLDFTGESRYAVSFDPRGFRDNASAMVNMVRAGALLFCRLGPDEDDAALCRRIAVTILMCERQEGNYLRCSRSSSRSSARQGPIWSRRGSTRCSLSTRITAPDTPPSIHGHMAGRSGATLHDDAPSPRVSLRATRPRFELNARRRECQRCTAASASKVNVAFFASTTKRSVSSLERRRSRMSSLTRPSSSYTSLILTSATRGS
jgi:hypothetical protein